jgi:hypothetical protein
MYDNAAAGGEKAARKSETGPARRVSIKTAIDGVLGRWKRRTTIRMA